MIRSRRAATGRQCDEFDYFMIYMGLGASVLGVIGSGATLIFVPPTGGLSLGFTIVSFEISIGRPHESACA